MADTKSFEQWVNIKITDPNLVDDLDKMVADDESDRSKFIRRLIRQEKARRQQLSLPIGITAARKSSKTAAATA